MLFSRACCLVLLVGCSAPPEQPKEPDPRPRCASAATKTVEATLARRAVAAPMAKTPEGQRTIAELSPRLAETITGLCVEDRWPDATTACFASDPDTLKCRDTLTPEQRGRYTTAMMQVMQTMTLAATDKRSATATDKRSATAAK
jgi:hypothetical protein